MPRIDIQHSISRFHVADNTSILQFTAINSQLRKGFTFKSGFHMSAIITASKKCSAVHGSQRGRVARASELKIGCRRYNSCSDFLAGVGSWQTPVQLLGQASK